MTIFIPKVKLRRRHPANHGGFRRLITPEIARRNAKIIQPRTRGEELWQGDCNREMAFMRLTSMNGAWAPKSEHRSSVGADPKKDNIAAWIPISEIQTDDRHIKLPGPLGARYR